MTPTSGRSPEISVATAQGPRDHQEDRPVHGWIDLPDYSGWFLAVFDGHGGAATADKASSAFPGLFRSQLQLNQGNAAEGFRETISALQRMTGDDLSGSTASMVFIPRDAAMVTWAVLGDSPVALLDAGGNVRVGPEHNVRTNMQERTAAERRGGLFVGGYLEDRELPGNGLQMTRSLGDAELARVLNREPDIDTLPLGGRGIVLVGTDGLLSPGEGPASEQLSRLLQLARQGAGAESLVQDALRRQTGDNVTAIVWNNVT